VRCSKSFAAVCLAFVPSAAALAWWLVPTADGSFGKRHTVVKAFASSTKPDPEGGQQVTIHLAIKEGYHILANPVRCPDLVSAETTLTITSADKLQRVKIDYPPGARRPLLGDEVFYVYEGKVEIKAFVKRSAGGAAPLNVVIRCAPRSNRIVCLPETIKLQVK
jgi:hypothetical protein